ncbi:MAG: hypothetical protein QF735_03510 [Phycisphaeraceae bacterium]|nr:hypothetical protein [Phycisphaeraceae bacterium]
MPGHPPEQHPEQPPDIPAASRRRTRYRVQPQHYRYALRSF